ncbi:MAG: Fe-S cluster assembly protein SufD [Bacteroidia bacterium]|nr:MAG: Fe-S cluster assembly protein SufD [Bacteroidia bacterium]
MGRTDRARAERLKERYIERFGELQAGRQVQGPMQTLATSAAEQFASLGFPGPKDEAWKHLDPLAHFEAERSLVQQGVVQLEREDIFRCDIPRLDAHEVCFDNGLIHMGNGQRLRELPCGAIVGSLAEAQVRHPELVSRYLSMGGSTLPDGVAALAQMFATDGLFVYVPKGAVVDKPIQVVAVTTGDQALLMGKHSLIVLEEGAEAQMAVSVNAAAPSSFLVNDLMHVHLGPSARLELELLQNVHDLVTMFLHSFAYLKRNARLVFNTIALHGGMIRNSCYLRLEEEGVEAMVNGLSMVHGAQHIDAYTQVDHLAPACSSSQLFKNVVDEQGATSFFGTINVHPDAQGTQAFQRNANILLSDEATAHTRPQLIIHADDVKCSHGATIGQLDEEARFYLQSRGIPPAEVNRLLMLAFAGDIVRTIGIPQLREQVEALVEKRVRGEHDACFLGIPED